MEFELDIEREDDGRWIAEVVDLPGALADGETRDRALGAAEALALCVIADRLEHGATAPEPVAVSLVAAA